jgi:hypothetical protein
VSRFWLLQSSTVNQSQLLFFRLYHPDQVRKSVQLPPLELLVVGARQHRQHDLCGDALGARDCLELVCRVL